MMKVIEGAYPDYLKSASRWRKLGRKPRPDAEPSMVVRKKAVVGDPLPTARVIRHIKDSLYLCVIDGYEVYAFDQTEPIVFVSKIRRKPEKQNISPQFVAAESASNPAPDPYSSSTSSSTRDSSLPSHFPYDVEDVEKSTIKSKPTKKLQRKAACKKKSTLKAYLPEGLDLGLISEPCRAGVSCLVHFIYLNRVLDCLEKDAFVNLKAEYLRKLIPDWKTVKHAAVESGLVECDGIYRAGIKSFGYRLADPVLRQAQHRLYPIEDAAIARRMNKRSEIRYSVQRWLKANNERLEVANIDDRFVEMTACRSWRDDGEKGSVAARKECYLECLRWIRDAHWVFSFDGFARRCHNNATALKRECRRFLRVNGIPLVEIDIKNSQPLFIGLAAREKGVDDERYLRLCEQDLYQYLADKGKWTRDKVKQQLTQRALFAPNDHKFADLPVWKLFAAEFPAIVDFCRRMKAGKKTDDNDHPHNLLARLAQKMEANFVIFTVCERIRREKPDIWLLTIHDSILTLPEHADYILSVMRDEFARRNVAPRLEIKPLCP